VAVGRYNRGVPTWAVIPALLAVLPLAGGCTPLPRSARDATSVAKELATLRPGSACRAVLRGAAPGAESPGGLERLRQRARCRAAFGEAGAAVAEARAAVAARPDDPLPHVELALALLAAAPARPAAAAQALDPALRLRPDRWEYPYLKGVLLLDDEQVAAARPLLERAVALDGKRAAPRLALAQACLDAGDVAAARAALTPVPELEPSADEVARGRRLAARLGGVLRGLPPAVRAAYRRAAGLLERDLPGQAVAALEELLRARPRFAGAHTLLGLAHLKLGNDARAFAALQRAAELNPDDATNQVYLGLIYLAMDRGAQAATHLERGLALDPFNLRATAGLARIHADAKEWRAAARLYARLAALDGGEGATLRALARALTAAGDRDGAERALLRAVAREPSSYENNLLLGEAYQSRVVEVPSAEAQVYATKARRHLRRALEARPGDAAARRALDRLK
jgi:tetratricopeptide (TPR) repeat protein